MGEVFPKGLIAKPRFDYEHQCIFFDFWCLGRRKTGSVKVVSQILPDVAVQLFEAAWPRLWFEAVCTQPTNGVIELDFTV
jgi:hypothetical protein